MRKLTPTSDRNKTDRNQQAIDPDQLPPIQLDETIRAKGLESDQATSLSNLLNNVNEDNTIYLNPQQLAKRFKEILGTENTQVTPANSKKYLRYLKSKFKLPCQASSMDYFPWEEEYILGDGSPKQYERLKKTNPSYTDTFKIIKFGEIDPEDGILVEVLRLADDKRFLLPLGYLDITDEDSDNAQLVNEYDIWFNEFGNQ